MKKFELGNLHVYKVIDAINITLQKRKHLCGSERWEGTWQIRSLRKKFHSFGVTPIERYCI